MAKMIFIDANLFLAYHNANDVHHAQAKELWKAIEDLAFGPAFASDYVFNEVVGVALRKLGKEPALAIGNQILASTPLFTIDKHTRTLAWTQFGKSDSGLSFVDCTHLAAMRVAGATHIATFDKEFKKVPGITIVP